MTINCFKNNVEKFDHYIYKYFLFKNLKNICTAETQKKTYHENGNTKFLYSLNEYNKFHGNFHEFDKHGNVLTFATFLNGFVLKYIKYEIVSPDAHSYLFSIKNKLIDYSSSFGKFPAV
jgi:hypothetical protein